MRHPALPMRSRSSQRLLPSLAVVAGALFTATLAAAPQDDGEDDYTYFETLDVQVVNVEVVVTGPGGEPVQGLGRDDFELLEDGVAVEITNFYSVADSPLEALDPIAAVEARRLAAPPDQQLHLAIFVDGMMLEPANRQRVLDAVREFLNYEQARPTSLVLATFDGNLDVESIPRFEPDLLEEKLATLERAASRGALFEMERRSLLKDLQLASRSFGQGGGGALGEASVASEALRTLNAIQTFADQQYDQARLSARALESVVEALAGLPGRKALLYVSGGLARHAGEALFYAWEGKYSGLEQILGIDVTLRARQLDTTPEILDLVRHANANRVTFYTIGAGRGGFPGSITAEEGGFDSGGGGPTGGRTWSASNEAIDNSNLGGTLQELAAATGGLSMTNSRNFERLLTEMNRDFGAYYSLGYTPDREPDGRSHKLEVRVKGRDLDVRYRETFREQTREEVMTGRTRSAVLLGSRENPLAVAMEFGRVTAEEKDRYLVPVMVKVPLGNLVLLPQDEVHVGRIGIFICARDGQGRTSPVQSIDVPIRVPNDRLLTALGQVAGYRMVLQMRGEEHVVAVGVRDELGRIESTVTGRWDPTTPTG